MVLVIICCLFVFLGMFIGNKWNLKSFSINMIFGLFFINCLVLLLPSAYSILNVNYHDTTIIYFGLSIIVGYLFIRMISLKYDNCDNISILGFVVINSYLLYIHKFNILFYIINILYYIIIGIYIRNSKSWVSVIIGCFIGLLLSFISGFYIGFTFCVVSGFIAYFVVSVFELIIRGNNFKGYLGLITGIIIGFLGGIL